MALEISKMKIIKIFFYTCSWIMFTSLSSCDRYYLKVDKSDYGKGDKILLVWIDADRDVSDEILINNALEKGGLINLTLLTD